MKRQRKVPRAELFHAHGRVIISNRLICEALRGPVLVVFLLVLALSESASQLPIRRAQAQNAATPRLVPGLRQEFKTVAPGIEHGQIVRGSKSESEATGPWFINLMRLDLTKAKLRWVHALDEAIGLETVSSMATRYGAIAAVNSGYFRTTGTYRGDSIGVGVLNGKLISEPHNNRASMGLIETPGKTEVIFGHLSFNASLTALGSASRAVDGFNRPRAENELIIFTPEFHRTTLTNPDGLELIVRRGRIVDRHDRKGSSVIPADGFVISAGGAARKWVLDNLPTGARLRLNSSLTPLDRKQAQLWKQATTIGGGGPQLIKDGRIQITTAAEKMLPNFATDRHPRTAVGKLRDGRILFLTVDGRQAGVSVGMSLNELAALLLEFGATEAINLDGGGSTTMVIKNKIVNKPSDASGERPVSDAILVFSRKAKNE